MSAKTKARRETKSRPAKEAQRSARRAALPISADHSKRRGVYTQLGYHSVRIAFSDGRVSMGGGGDLHLRFSREQLINQSREFIRDNGLYRGMIDRAACYITGNGFTLQAKSGDEEWDAKVEAWWNDVFWKKPEIRGILSGRRVERQICKELLTCGDVAALKTSRRKLQLVEAEQIVGPSQKDDGLQKDRAGAITGYYLAKYTKDGILRPSEAKFYDPANVLFICDPERPSSSRAVPPAQASFPMLHRINDVCDSEAQAWQQLARLALIINKKDSGISGLQTSDEDDAKRGADQPYVTNRIQDWEAGTSFWGEVGEEIRGVERNIPGGNFPASLTMFLRLLGLPLGLPLEMVLLDWTKSNYSQSRAVLEQAFVTFQGWQLMLEEDFLEPVFRWAVDQAIKDGLLDENEGRYRHEWIKPTFPWLDQLAEAQAWGAKLDRTLCTQAQVLKSLNKDYADVMNQRESEFIDAVNRSKRIFEKTGEKVDWRLLAGVASSVNGGGAQPKDENQAAADGKKAGAEGGDFR